jgi:hypothetical protein
MCGYYVRHLACGINTNFPQVSDRRALGATLIQLLNTGIDDHPFAVTEVNNDRLAVAGADQ